jgi:hypothetical protein
MEDQMPRWNASTRQTGPGGEWLRTVGGRYGACEGQVPPSSQSLDPMRLTGFSHLALQDAFDRVRDPCDWQGPIFAQIASADRRLVARAIYWFTATVPVFAALPRDPLHLIVTAVGYRLGPAGH